VAALDNRYHEARLRLVARVVEILSALWNGRDPQDRSSYLDPAYQTVEGGSQAYVRLMNAYFASRALAVGGDAHEVDPLIFSVPNLRIKDSDFLNQPYGVLITKLEDGMPFEAANRVADAYTKQLGRTHLQLAHTRAADEWLRSYPESEDKTPILGYRRVWSGGCAHCLLAAERIYSTGMLAPIHNGCTCGIAPVFQGEDHGLFTGPKGKPYRFLEDTTHDSTLGPKMEQSAALDDTQIGGDA